MNTSTRIISDALDAISPRKNQTDIAKEIGYRPNMISMIASGKTRVPFEIIPELAEALEIDPALLLRALLSEYWPGREKTIAQVFGSILTTDEVKIINVIRSATLGKNLTVTTDLLSSISKLFAK